MPNLLGEHQWDDDSVEAQFHKCILFLSKRDQGRVMGAFRAILPEMQTVVLQQAAKVCGDIYQDHRDQYKGRGKYPPNNPRRADTHCDGCADGALQCEEAIEALIPTPRN